MLSRIIDPYAESLETSFDKYCAIKVVLQNTSKIIEQLNEIFPLENIRHVKRIKKVKDQESVIALVCKISGEDDCIEIHEKLQKYSISFVEILSVNIPIRHPVTKKQYETWNSIWPLVFHESMDEKLKLKQLLDHTNVFKQYNKYFTSKCLTGMIIEIEKYLEYDEKKIIYESISKNIMCDEPHNSYPFDHFVLNCLSGHQINKRITRNGKVPYLLSGCIAILLHEPCTMCAMALLHSRIDAVIYFNRNICAGALGSKCFLNYTNSLNHHFPVYLVDDDVVNN